MIEEISAALTFTILFLGCGVWPVAFLFAGCAPCCGQDACGWAIHYSRCVRVTDSVTGEAIGDCRVYASSLAPFDLEEGISSVGVIQILNRASKMQVPILLELSASGTSRTPVGQTRTQVWRLGVAWRPSDLSPYDVPGPPWHLQVDLSVTGVATKEESRVESLIGVDQYGQPKLVFNVMQWELPITQSETVTLYPTGLQRLPEFQVDDYRILFLSSGTAFSGWVVSKTTGRTVMETATAVAINRLCSEGGRRTRQAYILDENAAVAFLSGSTTKTVQVVNEFNNVVGTCDLQALPDNPLCQISSGNLGIGIALGAYPHFMRATSSTGEVATLTPMPLDGALFYNENRAFVSGRPTSITPVSFYRGSSLLSVMTNGPYRRSFTSGSWTYEIGGNSPSGPGYQPSRLPTSGGPVFLNGSFAFNALANTSRFPRVLARGDVLQDAAECRLRGISIGGLPGAAETPLAQTDVLDTPDSPDSIQVGECRYYAPVFGAELTSPQERTNLPCDGCQVDVQVVSGQQNAVVTLLKSGRKAGFIQLVALRDWLPGDFVRFNVTCGDDLVPIRVIRPAERPPAPVNLSVVRGPCSEALLSWSPPVHDGGTPIKSYVIDFRPIDGGAFQTYAIVSATSLSVTVFGLVRVGYEFRVAAINNLGTGAYAIASTGFALGPPTNLVYSRVPPACGDVTLTWTPPTQSECVVVASYRLEWAASGGWISGGILPGSETSGTISGVPISRYMSFRVARVADTGSDLFSNSIQVDNSPRKPVSLEVTTGQETGSVDLTWVVAEQPCALNTDYTVQFRPTATTTWTTLVRPVSTIKAATVTELTPGVAYVFRVRAVNEFGVSSYEVSSIITIPSQ